MVIALMPAEVKELKDSVIRAGAAAEYVTDTVIRNFSDFCQVWAEEDNWTFTLPNFRERLFRVFGLDMVAVNNAILGRFVATDRLSEILDEETLNGVKEGIDILGGRVGPEPLLVENLLTEFVDLVGQKYAGKKRQQVGIKALASEINSFSFKGIDVMPYLRFSPLPLAAAVEMLASAKTYLPYFEFVRYLPEAPQFFLVENWLPKAKASITELWQTRVGELPKGVSLEILMELLPKGDVGTANLDAFRRAILLHNTDQKPSKPFAFGEMYAHASIYGLKERRDGFETVQALVYSLISRDKERAASGAELFEHENITAAQDFTARHNVSRREMYRKVQPYLIGLSAWDKESALKVLEIFRTTYDSHVIRDLIAGVESLFSESGSFDALAVRTQQGTLDDLFDNRTLMACSFFPNGLFKYASLEYLLHPDIALLHFVPLQGRTEGKPIGVATLAIVEDVHSKQYLLVDSVEGGEKFQRIRESVWKPLLGKALTSFAASVGGLENEILVNYEFTGGGSIVRKATDYLLLGPAQKTRMRLRLPNAAETPVYLEAFKVHATHRFKWVNVYVLNAAVPSPALQ